MSSTCSLCTILNWIMGQYGHVSIQSSPTGLTSSKVQLVVLQQIKCKFHITVRKLHSSIGPNTLTQSDYP